jgi:LysM repeat protein
MKKRSSAPARVLAAIAVIGGFVLVVAVVSSSLGGSDSSNKASSGKTHHHAKPKTTAATYEVQEGDTLIAIAHETGIPVAKIERLNPGVDPQILNPGDVLKLR